METKICSRCGVEKELSLFSKQASNKDGYRGVCKECMYGHPPLKRYTKNTENLIVKECLDCGKTLPVEMFDTTKRNGKDYYMSSCKPCRNKRNAEIRAEKNFYRRKDLYKKYGITIEDFNMMLLTQNNKCKICGEEFTFSGKITAYVDHDHSTGKIRGLLCAHCNSGLGFFNDSTDNLKAAIKYLEDYQES